MNHKISLLLTPAICLMLLVGGCKKLVHQNIQAASNSSLAIIAYNDVFNQLNRAVSSEITLDAMTDPTWDLPGSLCADVTLSPIGASFPKTLTIDFGTGCIGPDGITRRGKIVAVFDGNFRTEGTSVVLSFDGYTKGQYAVAGRDSISNTGTDGDGNPIFDEVIRDGAVSWGTQQVLWHADLSRTWLEGDDTNFTTDTVGGTLGMAGLTDDVFSILGTATGNDSNTHPFVMEVTNSLVLPTDCKYITDGLMIVSPVNYNSGTIDYGSGECDKQATMEVDGEVFNFTM